MVHDGPSRKRAIQSGCAELKHLGLEHRAPSPDLPPARFAAARRVREIVPDEPVFLRAVIDPEQEDLGEQVHELV